MGVKVSENESSRERTGQGAKVPGNELATERKTTEQIGQGPIGRFDPASKLAW